MHIFGHVSFVVCSSISGYLGLGYYWAVLVGLVLFEPLLLSLSKEINKCVCVCVRVHVYYIEQCLTLRYNHTIVHLLADDSHASSKNG